MSRNTNPVLTFRKPSLTDERHGQHLLVWGGLATWMLMDDELLSLCRRFDGKKNVAKVISQHAAQWKKSLDNLAREAQPILGHLLERRILTVQGQSQSAKEEPLEIANVTLNPTNRCNLSCPFCYNEKRQGVEIPAGSIVSFLREGKDFYSKESSLIILGGEPTLDRVRLFEILDGTKDVFTRPAMISTNGTLLDEEMVDALVLRQVEVQISLDSPEAQVHDAGRGTGVFDLATNGIRRLVEAGAHTILSMVYNANNIDEMENYLQMALDLGVSEARFIPLRNAGAAGDLDHSLRPNQLIAFEKTFEILERRPEFQSLLKRDFFSIAATLCRYSSSRVSCGIARRVVFIDADGSVYPCPNHATPEFLLGTIEARSLEEIMVNGSTAQELRTRYHVENYSRCKACPFRGWCAGDCRGEVIALTDDPFAPSPHCNNLKKVYLELLWMIASNDPRTMLLTENGDVDSGKDVFL